MTRWTGEQIDCLKRHWAEQASINAMVRDIGFGRVSIEKKAKELGLGVLNDKAVRKAAQKRLVADLKHRNANRQPDPVRLRPSQAMFGTMLRVVEPRTRKLIDAALAVRAQS